MCHDPDNLRRICHLFIFHSSSTNGLYYPTRISIHPFRASSLKGKFVALEQENRCLLGNLQQFTIEKQQQDKELTLQVQQREGTVRKQVPPDGK